VYHKTDAGAGRNFFPKYDKQEYMAIAKFLLGQLTCNPIYAFNFVSS
jgi:hypothetical protein